MIIFKDIKWKNLLSTGDKFTEVDLQKSELTLIVGKNGGGKSTILDALCLVLYNKPFRDINKPQIVNTINNKNLLVEINFQIGSDNYFIRRGMKANIFEIYKNSDLLNQSADARDYQEILEKQILRMNYKAFCQVDILGTASFTPFMKLNPADRRMVIEDLLDIQVFSKMNVHLKEKVNTNLSELRKIESDSNAIEAKIDLQKENESDIAANNGIKILRLKDDIIIAEANKVKSSELVAVIQKEIQELMPSLEIKSKVEKKHTDIISLKSQLKEKVSAIEKDIDFFTKNTSCPTCRQEIDEKFKCDHVEERSTNKTEIEEGLLKLEDTLNKEKAKLEYISKIQCKLNSLNISLSTENTKIDSFNREVKRYTSEIEILEKPVVIKVSRVDEFQKELSLLEDKKYALMKEKDALSICGVILKDSGIKARIVKQYIPIINNLINKYLSDMDFFVSFELDENFKETIKSRYRDTFTYSSFSEGEKMRINLAILFTWRAISKMRNAASTNLLIMDEVLDSSLDTEGMDDFIQIIQNLTKGTNCFIISHKGDALENKFSSVIKFEKQNNFSVIV